MKQFTLKDKHIIVTGASRGIGKQCAIDLSMAGANVSLIARDEKKLTDTLLEMESGKHNIYSFDLNNVSKIKELVKLIVSENGKIDGFIHAAGIEITKPFRQTKTKELNEQMTVNTFSGIELVRQISSANNIASKASIVFISSISGILGFPSLLGYSMSKGAILAATRCLAVELSKKCIRVNSVSPGQVKDTDMTKSMFKLLPEISINKSRDEHLLGWIDKHDVSNTCIFLLSEASKKITGQNIILDSGYSIK